MAVVPGGPLDSLHQKYFTDVLKAHRPKLCPHGIPHGIYLVPGIILAAVNSEGGRRNRFSLGARTGTSCENMSPPTTGLPNADIGQALQ